ncbi:hypothetical protein JCM13664_06400 [Methylothermus subterraneus]
MRYLFVVRDTLSATRRVQEALDLVLTLAAFDQTVDVLVMDDGVWQLHRDQQLEILGDKNIAALWQALEIYGLASPWVESESLRERGVKVADLVVPVRLVRRAELPVRLREYDRILKG